MRKPSVVERGNSPIVTLLPAGTRAELVADRPNAPFLADCGCSRILYHWLAASDAKTAGSPTAADVRQRQPQKVGPMPQKKIAAPLEIGESRLNALALGIVSRSELGKLTGGLLNPKTLANWDSQGRGPKRKIIGPRGKVAYYVEDVVELLVSVCRVEGRRER